VGWEGVAAGLEGVTSVTSLNGVEGCGPLFAGGQTEIDMPGKRLREREAAVVVARLLLRSADTLQKLDLRCGETPSHPR
jgi:hypothetical protein